MRYLLFKLFAWKCAFILKHKAVSSHPLKLFLDSYLLPLKGKTGFFVNVQNIFI